MSTRHRKKGVHVIPAKHYDRKKFDSLLKAGLAIKGYKISLPEILQSLKLKELSVLASDLNPPKFSKKIKAIEYLLKVSDIKNRVNKTVSLRTLFQIKPLSQEFTHIDIEKVSMAWRYAQEISGLIYGTYMHASYSTRDRNNREDMESDFIRGWKFSIIDDVRCCPYCRRLAKKKYSKKQYPVVPHHLGCRYSVMPILKIDVED